jgi:hypothetical protein
MLRQAVWALFTRTGFCSRAVTAARDPKFFVFSHASDRVVNITSERLIELIKGLR